MTPPRHDHRASDPMASTVTPIKPASLNDVRADVAELRGDVDTEGEP
jgi:hypothetical protein